MKLVERRDATASLASYAEMAEEEPVVVTVDGKPMAALMALENADLESVSLSTNPTFLRLIERSRARYREEGGISPEEMRRRLGLGAMVRPHRTAGRRPNAMPKGGLHVVLHRDGWAVMSEGNRRATSVHDTQAQAIDRAREIARKRELEVIVHRRDGTVRDRGSHGRDSYPPPDRKQRTS